MSARVLVIDIETTRAVVETFSLWPKYIGIDRVVRPSRILCWAATWRGSDQMIFKSSWKDDDEESYRKMIKAAWNLFDEADFICTYNGDKFDLQWLQAEFGRLEMGPPSPYRSIDLIKTAKRHFKQGLMSLKLDWQAKQWLGDSKVSHSEYDLWDRLRYGNREQRREAARVMRSYCEHDTRLTAQLLERYLPWIGENFALYEDHADDGALRCVKCDSENVQRRGTFPTKTCMYPRWRCNDCGSWSKGRKMLYTNELRPV